MAVLLAVLGIACGRVAPREEARAPTRHERVDPPSEVIRQPALVSAAHPLPPPTGCKQLAHLPTAQGLLAPSSIRAACLIAAHQTGARMASLSARAARAPPSVRS